MPHVGLPEAVQRFALLNAVSNLPCGAAKSLLARLHVSSSDCFLALDMPLELMAATLELLVLKRFYSIYNAFLFVWSVWRFQPECSLSAAATRAFN